jgi:hypothetical protein
VGNVGIVTAVSTLLLSLGGMSAGSVGPPLVVLAAGLSALAFLGSSTWVDGHLCAAISWALRRFTDLDARDYARLLHLREDYGVCELSIAPGDWLRAGVSSRPESPGRVCWYWASSVRVASSWVHQHQASRSVPAIGCSSTGARLGSRRSTVADRGATARAPTLWRRQSRRG